MATWNQLTPEEQAAFLRVQDTIRSALARARAALPESAASYATSDPDSPDSIGTVAFFERAMLEREFEVSLYALAQIADAVHAPPECWTALDDAARIMAIDPARYRR